MNIYDTDRYYDEGEYFLYSFNDKPYITEVVLKIYSKHMLGSFVVTLTESYSRIYELYGFNEKFAIKHLDSFRNIEDIHVLYPQYFI